MAVHAVRPASESDSAALIDFEQLCPQGTYLRLFSEREDYFFRARLCGDTRTLVVGDQERRRIFGVLLRSAAAPR